MFELVFKPHIRTTNGSDDQAPPQSNLVELKEFQILSKSKNDMIHFLIFLTYSALLILYSLRQFFNISVMLVMVPFAMSPLPVKCVGFPHVWLCWHGNRKGIVICIFLTPVPGAATWGKPDTLTLHFTYSALQKERRAEYVQRTHL